MGDLIAWAFLSALMLYAGLGAPKNAPFFRLLMLWFAIALTALEVLDLHGSSPHWTKWPIVAVAIALGIASFVRDENGQRTRYGLLWATVIGALRRRA